MIKTGRSALVVMVLAGSAVLMSADAAGAHGGGGIHSSNLETRVTSVEPRISGIVLRVVDLGERLELENRTGADVIVLGYDDEPYLRVGRSGAFENVRSPTVYINRKAKVVGRVPASADAAAEPEWRRISGGTTVAWHDHRAHWMGSEDPPAARRDPGRRHLIQRFTVELSHPDDLIRARGTVRWVPGPSPWPWVLGALGIAIAVVILARTRHTRIVLLAALAVLVVSEIAHVIGAWNATTAGGGAKVTASAYSLGGLALAMLALSWLARRGTYAAAPVVLFAGLMLALAGGLADVTTLARSQLPTTSPHALVRLEVMLALGLGAGLAAAAFRGLPNPGRARYGPGYPSRGRSAAP